MPSVAVQLTSEDEEIYRGILLSDPKVGKHCKIYLGSDKQFTIQSVKGWIRAVGGDYTIIFDGSWKKFRMSVIATSDEFL